MRNLRLLWARFRPILCQMGIHRWEGLYAPGRGGKGSGRYLRVSTCIWCRRER